MRYLPHTHDDIQSMLATIGVDSIDKLFDSIPAEVRLQGLIDFPPALCEPELRAKLKQFADTNIHLAEGVNFIGAGAYHHYVPSVISHLVKRGEFLTAYTPYQPEVSQGTLQAMFEFQTMVCELTRLEVANASNYDISTACPEAIMMAKRVTGKSKMLVARSLHPHYREVMATYFKNQPYEITEIPFTQTGQLDLNFLEQNLTSEVGAVLVQSPNFFGTVEDLKTLGAKIKQHDCLYIVATPESLSYAVLASPGECGADIAIAEGMSFGLGANYGGPYLGLFATREKFLRQMPGRIVGQTTDVNGKRGFVLTMSTREQHIRREKATSNICTNQGLCALVASVYLSLLGPTGLKKLAMLNMKRLNSLKSALLQVSKKSVLFSGPNFNEMVVALKVPARDIVIRLLKDKVFSGIDMATYYPEFENHLLVCTTEMVNETDIKMFAERLAPYLA